MHKQVYIHTGTKTTKFMERGQSHKKKEGGMWGQETMYYCVLRVLPWSNRINWERR